MNILRSPFTRLIFLGVTGFLLVIGVGRAQTALSMMAPPTTVITAKTEETVQLGSFEVTGSRIRLNAGEAPALPIFELSQVQLEQLGVNRLADIRQAIPQLAPALGFNDNLVNSGPSRGQQVSTSFNLRGLGGGTTLVLVDGHRVPHSGQEAPGGAGGREDFDIDGIPINAIERIEILPQGASAIYGSEAIAGVVNVILKKSYTGAQLSVNYDNTFSSDVGDLSVALTAGYRRNKLSTFLTLNWEKQNELRGIDRWFTAKDGAFYGASASYYNSQVASGPGSLSSTSSPQNANQANLAGLTTNILGIPVGSKGSGLTTVDYVAAGAPSAQWDPSPYNAGIDAARRRSFLFKADYDYALWLQPYLQVRKARFNNSYTSTPTPLTIQLPVGAPGNPFAAPVWLRKVFWDLAPFHQDSYQDNSGLVAGVRGRFLQAGVAGGRFLKEWRYDASVNYSRNIIDDLITVNTFNSTALTAALNDPNPANRPILAYDSSRLGNNPNAAGVLEKFLIAPSAHHHDYTDVDQYTFQTDGSLWTGWAGDLRGAVGGEASSEKVHFYRDPGAPSYILTKPFGRRMTAAFAEISVPLLGARQQIPLVHRLEIGGAVRTEDFSDVGTHRTPRYNALYQPIKWLTIRASRSEGFKVPRLYDLQGPVTSGSTINLTATSNVHDTLRGGEAVIGTMAYSSGGNPTLKPETSVSKNGGVVIDVPGKWFKGLSFSVDTWELHYFNKVGTAGYQLLIDNFPERVTRAAPSSSAPAGYAGLITGFNSTNINLAKYDTRGVDYAMSYQHATPLGTLTVSGAFSNPKTIASKSTPAVTAFSYTWLPERLSGSVFIRKGSWTYGTTTSYQALYRISTSPTAIPYPSVTLWNPQVAYDFGRNASFNDHGEHWWQRWLADTKISFTIPNALNRGPSLLDKYSGRYGVYDPRLRRYVLNFAKKL